MRKESPTGMAGAVGILVVMLTGALGCFSVVRGRGMGWQGAVVSMLLLGGLMTISVLGVALIELVGGCKSARRSRILVLIIVAVHLMLLPIVSIGSLAVNEAFNRPPPYDLQEFRMVKSELLAIAEQPTVTPDQLIVLNQRIGSYHVDVYAVDSRGGVYFRTHSRPDYVDTISEGFCLTPNRRGTPFGAAWYRTIPIEDGWYWFKVSDDHY